MERLRNVVLMTKRRRKDDRGVVLVEFALVVVVFLFLVIGGLFILLRTVSKGASGAEVNAAANFVALGGCPAFTTTTSSTTTTLPTCVDQGTPSGTQCMTDALQNGLPDYSIDTAAASTTTTGTLSDPSTMETICEIEQILSQTFVADDPSSLQVAINCSDAVQDSEAGVSGYPCAGSTAVWVCAREFDTNTYPGIIGQGWVSDATEQLVVPMPPAVTTTVAPTTTGTATTTTVLTGPQLPPLDFDTYFPANTYNGDAPLTCGPMSNA